MPWERYSVVRSRVGRALIGPCLARSTGEDRGRQPSAGSYHAWLPTIWCSQMSMARRGGCSPKTEKLWIHHASEWSTVDSVQSQLSNPMPQVAGRMSHIAIMGHPYQYQCACTPVKVAGSLAGNETCLPASSRFHVEPGGTDGQRMFAVYSVGVRAQGIFLGCGRVAWRRRFDGPRKRVGSVVVWSSRGRYACRGIYGAPTRVGSNRWDHVSLPWAVRPVAKRDDWWPGRRCSWTPVLDVSM